MTRMTRREATGWIVWMAACALHLLVSDSRVLSAEQSGGGKVLVIGQVVSFENDRLVVREGKGTERALRLTGESGIRFVGFRGIGQPADSPQPGFGVKATVGDGDVVKGVLFTPPIPPLDEIPDKHKLTTSELFHIADQNMNGRVDYVEYSARIFQSYKHLPDRFPKRLDADGDDTLDLQEFTDSLALLDWWRLSRMSADEWVRSADKDNSGELNHEEARTVTGGAHGKFDKLFDRLDRDHSGGISTTELEPFLESNITGR